MALVNTPSCMLAICSVTLKDVSSGRLSLSCGFMMTVDTMLVVAGILPIGMPLHEPCLNCMPLVSSWPSQKLMKLPSSLHRALASSIFQPAFLPACLHRLTSPS